MRVSLAGFGGSRDEARNRAFFSRFLAPSDDGMLLGAWRDEGLLGYACLYWHFTSLVPAETVLLNDLYVAEARRGEGVGRALIEASATVARERGAHQLQWVTAPTTRPPGASTTPPAPKASLDRVRAPTLAGTAGAQWCSMTRSTMLYSFASSALMK